MDVAAALKVSFYKSVPSNRNLRMIHKYTYIYVTITIGIFHKKIISILLLLKKKLIACIKRRKKSVIIAWRIVTRVF